MLKHFGLSSIKFAFIYADAFRECYESPIFRANFENLKNSCNQKQYFFRLRLDLTKKSVFTFSFVRVLLLKKMKKDFLVWFLRFDEFEQC